MFSKIATYLRIYNDRRMLIILLLGFASGFPFPLVFNTLSLWLKFDNLSLELIGIFSLAKLPYSLKWLWSPVLDNIRLPYLGKLGRRRSWAFLAQIFIGIFIFAASFANPGQTPWVNFGLAMFLAFSSATLDIALDAYRVESFSAVEQAAASASFVTGYRLGFLVSGAGALYLAQILDWGTVYLLMTLGVAVGLITILLAHPTDKNDNIKTPQTTTFKNFLKTAFLAPLKEFIRRRHWQLILLFVFLYRMSDAYISPMAYVFYKDIGFDYDTIASITKVFGTIATIGGVLLGGIILNRISLNKGLILCGILQALSNLVYVAQAHIGDNQYMLMLTIFAENVTSGMGTAAFMAYISSLCNVAYTATQYALLSSLMSLARDGLAATSGKVAAVLGWSNFFIFSTLIALPGLIVLLILIRLQQKKPISSENCWSGAMPHPEP